MKRSVMQEKAKVGNEAIRVSIAKTVSQVVFLVAAMLMSRYLTLEEYGTYSQVVLIVTMLTSIFMLGLPNSMNYFMGRAEDEIQKKEFLSVFYSLCTLLCFSVGIIAFGGLPLFISYYRNPQIKTLGFFLLLYPFGRVITQTSENLFVVYHKTRLLLVFRVSYSVLLVASIIASNAFHLTFRTCMLLYLSVSLFFALLVFICAHILSGGIKLCLSIDLVKRILSFSLPLGLASTVGTINIELDKLMVGRYVDTSTLAIYTNASKEMPVTMIASAFTAVMLPRFAHYIKEKHYTEVVKMWGSATKLSFMILCFLAIGMHIFAPDCLQVLYSEKYVQGANIFRVYTLVLLLRATYFGIILNSSGHSRLILYSAIASLGLNCILNIILFKLLGLIGPAVATLVSQLLIDFFQLCYSGKILCISISRIFQWQDFFRILLINIVLGVVFYFLKIIVPLEIILGNELESIVLAVIWGALEVLFLGKEWINEINRFNSI